MFFMFSTLLMDPLQLHQRPCVQMLQLITVLCSRSCTTTKNMFTTCLDVAVQALSLAVWHFRPVDSTEAFHPCLISEANSRRHHRSLLYQQFRRFSSFLQKQLSVTAIKRHLHYVMCFCFSKKCFQKKKFSQTTYLFWNSTMQKH